MPWRSILLILLRLLLVVPTALYVGPTLFIWGSSDFAVTPSIVARQRPFMRGPYWEVRLEADHALMQHNEKAVTEAVLTHLLPIPDSQGVNAVDPSSTSPCPVM